MACKVGLLFIVLILLCGVYSMSSADYDYCVVGAGPGGKDIAIITDRYIVFQDYAMTHFKVELSLKTFSI